MSASSAVAVALFLLSPGTSNAFTTISHIPSFTSGTSSSKRYHESSSLQMVDPSSFSQDVAHFLSSALTLADADVVPIDAISDFVDYIPKEAVVEKAADAVPAVGEVSYSKVSYYSTLALYAMSFPGLWSTIKRSTKAKIKRKTYLSAGEAAKNGKDQRQQAGEIMAYMKANNYEVEEAGETITFRGLVARSTSQAFFLTFCTAIGMASLALVLQIQFQSLTLPFIGTPNWFYLVLLSPYAGFFYWNSGDRVDDIKVKLLSTDDDMENEITVEGNDEELERFWRALELNEKGMVKVDGILDAA